VPAASDRGDDSNSPQSPKLQPKSWRDVLPVHPAAKMFPLMSETDPAALKELGEDIKRNGLQVPILIPAQAKVETEEQLDQREAKAKVLQDVGEHRKGENARLHARIDELENQKRRLELENVGLKSEIDELKAERCTRERYIEYIRQFSKSERITEIQKLIAVLDLALVDLTATPPSEPLDIPADGSESSGSNMPPATGETSNSPVGAKPPHPLDIPDFLRRPPPGDRL
jgi:hypothetical protein